MLQKINKGVDLLSKYGLLVAVLGLSLLPLLFLFGNEQMHHQPSYDRMLAHSSKAPELEFATNKQFSNIYLHADGTLTTADIQQTVELGDYVCYWLQQSGQPVVRKNIQVSGKRKGKKAQVASLEGLETVHTLMEDPPLQKIRARIAEFVNFEDDSLKRKHWVIVSTAEPDSHFIREIETISDQNPGYKFTIVSPLPITHKLFKQEATNRVNPPQTVEQSATPAAETSEEQDSPIKEDSEANEKIADKNPRKDKGKVKGEKGRKDEQKGKKSKVKKVEVLNEEVGKQPEKTEL